MTTPLIIDEAAYQDIVAREGNTYTIQLDFRDSNYTLLDLSDYKFAFSASKKSRQTTPDIVFSTENEDITYVPVGSILWTILGSKTLGKEGSYVYHFDLIYLPNGAKQTFLYGMFTVTNKNS